MREKMKAFDKGTFCRVASVARVRENAGVRL